MKNKQAYTLWLGKVYLLICIAMFVFGFTFTLLQHIWQ